MAYSDFNLRSVVSRFGLTISDEEDLFHDVPERLPSNLLRETLSENVPLAMAIHTEKARSELIVAPVLVKARRCFPNRVSLFSGIELNADPEKGLNGVCDFILARSPVRHLLQRPVAIIVEAKRDCIPDGLGQCAASMLGARIFNERENQAVSNIHGAVTTGTLWQFLRLQGQTISLDTSDYSLGSIGKILGILIGILSENTDRGRTAA
jgi:hypothetical protein